MHLHRRWTLAGLRSIGTPTCGERCAAIRARMIVAGLKMRLPGRGLQPGPQPSGRLWKIKQSQSGASLPCRGTWPAAFRLIARGRIIYPDRAFPTGYLLFFILPLEWCDQRGIATNHDITSRVLPDAHALSCPAHLPVVTARHADLQEPVCGAGISRIRQECPIVFFLFPHAGQKAAGRCPPWSAADRRCPEIADPGSRSFTPVQVAFV